MDNVDFMHAVWGGVVTAFSFLAKKILNDYDKKIERMEAGEKEILKTLQEMNKMTNDMHVKLTRIEIKLEIKGERTLIGVKGDV